jgi:hypothetical protein
MRERLAALICCINTSLGTEKQEGKTRDKRERGREREGVKRNKSK